MQIPSTYDKDPFVATPEQNSFSSSSSGTSAPNASEARKSFVREWQQKIKQDKKKWDADFKRMRENMSFAAGYQWHNQQTVDDERYIANHIIRNVNQKVASLFARDPKVVFKRRKRLDYEIWDGKLETLYDAIQRAMSNPADIEAQALVLDYEQGRQWRQMCEKVGKTLELLFDYQMDSQQPGFKLQCKQLVRRVVTCGVGYVRPTFERTQQPSLTESTTDTALVERARRARRLLERLEKGEIDKTDPEVDALAQLTQSIMSGMQSGQEEYNPEERIVFDFPTATSIIPDSATRQIKGWVGANHLTQEYILPLEEINAFFEVSIKTVGDGGSVVQYTADGSTYAPAAAATTTDGAQNKTQKPMACLWRVESKKDGMEYFLVDGYEDFVIEPTPMTPQTNRFWSIIPLTFNDVESEEDGQRSTIFPPSDVQLMKSAQKEWNRSREALRKHRKANAPQYVVPQNALTDADLEKLASGAPNEVIQMQNVKPGDDMSKVIQAIQKVPIDPALYQTEPLAQDLVMTIGAQDANAQTIGMGEETATGATIKEQGRMTVASSNIDDLDECLSEIARYTGELMLKEMSQETVLRVVGRGAVWPMTNREDFCNEIFLEVIAASSGRPNKAMEAQNWQMLAPILQAAGASPQFMIRESVKRLDDSMEPDEAFPIPVLVPGMGVMPQNQLHQGGGEAATGLPIAQTPQNVTSFPQQDQMNPSQVEPTAMMRQAGLS